MLLILTAKFKAKKKQLVELEFLIRDYPLKLG